MMLAPKYFALVMPFVLLISSGHCRILELDERFREAKKNGEWLVMFYAPWCGHCKQLEPTWIEIGDAMEELLPVHVARLDCTRFSALSGEFGVRGFPTIKYISGDNEYEYRGARTKNDIIDFTKKARGPKVTVLTDNAQNAVRLLRDKGPIFFMYVGNKDDEIREKYDKVAALMFLSMNFYATTPDYYPAMNPTIMVFKDGTYYEMPPTVAISDFSQMLKWVASEQTSDYSHLTGASYHTLKNTGKLYAVAVLPEVGSEDLNNAAKDLALSRVDKFRPKFVFCWVQGNAVINKMTYATIKTPNFVAFNAQNYEYYVLNGDESTSRSISSEEIETFLYDVLAGKLTPLGGSGYMHQISRFFVDTSSMVINFFKGNPIIASLVFGVPTFLISFLCYCLCTMEEGSMEEEDEYSEDDEYAEDAPEPPQYEAGQEQRPPEPSGDDSNEETALRRRNVEGQGDAPDEDVSQQELQVSNEQDKDK